MLPLEMQGWDSGIMARAVFSLKGWQNVAFSVKKPRIKWRWLDSAELGALTEAGRKPSVNEKQFSLELLDLSLILNVTCRGTGSCPCNVASCGSLWCCLQVNLRAAGPRGKSCCPAPPSRAGIFTNPSPFLRFSTSSFFFFFLSLIIFQVDVSSLLVANRTEFAIDSWVTCFVDYFRSNPIKVNVSTAGKSHWITK